jgi:copper resistance protein D
LTALQAGLAASRLLSFATAMVLFGSGLFTTTFAAGKLAAVIARRLRPVLLVCGALTIVAYAASLPFGVATMAGGWRDAVETHVASTIMLETTPGRMMIVRLVLAVALAVVSLVSSQPRGAVVVLSGLLLASFAFSGHAVMDDGARGLFHRGNDVLHLLSGAAWLGSLVPLVPCLAALRDPHLCRDSGVALRKFSFAGHALVALVLATGICNALLVIGPPDQWLTASPYHLLLLGKIVLVACMVGLAFANRYVFVPRLQSDRDRALRAIERRTISEIALGAVVLGLVAIFGQLDPG